MTADRRSSTGSAEPNHGAHLAFRADTLYGSEVVRLPNSRVAVSAPTVLRARGPVVMGDRTLEVFIELHLDASAYRYRVVGLEVRAPEGEEVDPELLRRIRWAELLVGALDLFRVVTVAEDGTEETHRSLLTLTPDEQLLGLWLQARLGGLDANRHIAEQMTISTAAAATRVTRARKQNLIPPATQGQRR